VDGNTIRAITSEPFMPKLRFVWFVVCFAGAAAADDRATAQQLFEQAKRSMRNGKYAEACPKLEAAAELSRTPGVRLNLADCYAKIGRTASAWAAYEEAGAIAERAGDSRAVEQAKQARAALGPKLTYLAILVGPKVRQIPDLAITRDGKLVPSAAYDDALPVDPGAHELRASAPGYVDWTSTKEVAGAGAHVEIEVPMLDKKPDASTALPASAPVHEPASQTVATADIPVGDGSFRRTLAYVAGGLGIIGVGAGSYFALKANAMKDDYESHRNDDGTCRDLECETLSHDAHDAGNTATLAFIAGGSLLAASVVLYVTAPSRSARGPVVRASASASHDGARFGLGGNF
jgi:hypothetical protein